MSESTHSLFTTPRMTSVFSAQSHIRQMLVFEAALARAEARAGVIPQDAANAIAEGCQSLAVNAQELYEQAAMAGTPVIPLVRLVAAHVDADAQKFVHWGATSQDVIDTALMLQMREGLDILSGDLAQVCRFCAELAIQHRHTVMAGRTLLQQAVPITFGLKAARWLALGTRQMQTLRQCREQTLVLQFGGAAGTLAALGKAGLEVGKLLADELALPLPELPWHAERDRVATIASALGVTAGGMAKIASDVVLLAQTEVGEVSEAAAPDKGASSAMPQKQNPVDAVAGLAAARLATGIVPVILSAMANEHERAVGGWQAEWAAIPDLFGYTAGAVEHVRRCLAGLQVNAARMRANLELSGGFIMAEALTMALAVHAGRLEAQRLVKKVCDGALAAGVSLCSAALDDASIGALLAREEIERSLDPLHYLGSNDCLIDRALKTYQSANGCRLSAKQKDGNKVNHIDLNGVRAAFQVDGSSQNPAIVLVHCLGSDSHMWEPQVGPLSEHFRVVRYDLRGHGSSEHSQEPPSIERFGRDLLALLDHLQIGRAHVGGLSLGGLIAQWFTIHHPERVDRAVFANTAARLGSVESWEARIAAVRQGGMAAIRDMVIARFFSADFRARRPDVAKHFGDILQSTDPEGYIAACTALRDADLRTHVSGIQRPVLVIAGGLDEATPPQQSAQLHAAIAGSQLVTLKHAAHLSNMEEAGGFNDAVLEFLVVGQRC